VKPFMAGHFNHKFKALCTACGLSGVGFHTLRHTFASHLVMAGVPIVTVQALLGHSNIQTTMVYAHLSKDHKAQAVNSLRLLDQ
jgi:site-specific recombinase XerD